VGLIHEGSGQPTVRTKQPIIVNAAASSKAI
jgi:hypothetical protein